MIEEDTPRSYTSPRDDRFFTPRTIARSNSASNSDEWISPREFQTPRSSRDSDRKDRAYPPNHPYANSNVNTSKEFYNPNDYYHGASSQSKQAYYDSKGSHYPPYPQAGHHASAPSKGPSSSRRQYIAEEEDADHYHTRDDNETHVAQSFLDYDLEEIFSFARHGRCEEIDKLLDQGLPVDIRDEFGNTLLIIACQNGNKRVAKTVLRRGANINARNYKGNTPLHYCYQYGYGETLGQYIMSKVIDQCLLLVFLLVISNAIV